MKRFLLLCIAISVCGMVVGKEVVKPKIVAHRGYWRTEGSAQNTLTSFTKAAEVGCYGSEFDVWYTKDNKLVVNHDLNFKGVNMEENTMAEITAVKLPNGENIPTLDSYLEHTKRYPSIRLVLEAKPLSDINREDTAAKIIVEKLKQYGLLDRTDFISFSINYCLDFKKLLPDARIFYLGGDLPPKSIKRLGFAGMDYSGKVLRRHPEWVKQAHELGLEVNVFTINKPEDMRYFIEMGVDYITTDYPEMVKAELQR